MTMAQKSRSDLRKACKLSERALRNLLNMTDFENVKFGTMMRISRFLRVRLNFLYDCSGDLIPTRANFADQITDKQEGDCRTRGS